MRRQEFVDRQMRTGNQLALPLETAAADEPTFRAAHARSGLRLPFEVAMRVRATQICLRCYAEALRGARKFH